MEHAIDTLPKQIELGNQGESGILNIDLDCTTWLTDFPEGQIEATFIAPDSYKTDLLPGSQAHMLEDDVTFRVTVMRNMTRYAGKGSLNIRLVIGDDIEKRSAVAGTYTAPSHSTSAEEAPEDVSDWVNEAVLTLAEVEQALVDSGSATGAANSAAEAAEDSIIVSVAFVGEDAVFTKADGSTITLPGAKTALEGNGIASIIRTAGTGAPGSTDIYTITYTDATTSTFDVHNGVVGPIGPTGNAGISPAGTYANLAALIAASGKDNNRVYLTLDNGYWNYYNGFQWVAGGLYQATTIDAEFKALSAAFGANYALTQALLRDLAKLASTTAEGLAPIAAAPASGLRNILGIDNGETAYAIKALFDATAPSTQALGDAAAVGSAMAGARRDHKHAMPSKNTVMTELQTIDGAGSGLDADLLDGKHASVFEILALEDATAFRMYYAVSQALIRDLDTRLAIAEAELASIP